MILLQIHVNDIDSRMTLKNVSKNLKKAAGNAVFKIARKTEREIRKEVIMQGLIWRKRLRDSIKARRISGIRSAVYIVSYGIALDSMRPHVVALKRGRKITIWAREKGLKGKSIVVRPHPFIQAGILRGTRRAKQIMDREISNLIKRKGR